MWHRRLNTTLWSDHKPRVYVEPIAAGEAVVATNAGRIAILLRKHYSDAPAVEMEGRGFLQTAHIESRCRAVVVRGISDLLEGKAATDKLGWQLRAADAAAAFFFEMLALRDSLTPERAGQDGWQAAGQPDESANSTVSPARKAQTTFVTKFERMLWRQVKILDRVLPSSFGRVIATAVLVFPLLSVPLPDGFPGPTKAQVPLSDGFLGPTEAQVRIVKWFLAKGYRDFQIAALTEDARTESGFRVCAEGPGGLRYIYQWGRTPVVPAVSICPYRQLSTARHATGFCQ